MADKIPDSWRKRILREQLYLKQGGFCYYCLSKVCMSNDPTLPNHGTLDHVKPRSRGGKQVVLACRRCNQAKGNMTEAEFRKVVKEAGRRVGL